MFVPTSGSGEGHSGAPRHRAGLRTGGWEYRRVSDGPGLHRDLRWLTGQFDISRRPEILRAQRRHLPQLRDHPWQLVEIAVSDAAHAMYRALRGGTWIRANAGDGLPFGAGIR